MQPLWFSPLRWRRWRQPIPTIQAQNRNTVTTTIITSIRTTITSHPNRARQHRRRHIILHIRHAAHRAYRPRAVVVVQYRAICPRQLNRPPHRLPLICHRQLWPLLRDGSSGRCICDPRNEVAIWSPMKSSRQCPSWFISKLASAICTVRITLYDS